MSTAEQAGGLTPADRMEIQELYAHYCHCIDSGDGEGWADCFTPDGFLSLPYRDQVTRGTEQLKLVGDAFPARTDEVGRHVTVDISIRTEEDATIGRAYLILLRGGWNQSPPVIELTGRYHDRLVVLDGRWRFASRTLTVDAPQE